MRRALELARLGAGLAPPNPMVGAVLVSPDGDVVGEGWHEGPGTAHAEVVALRAAGDRARGATLYTTLEPCSHTGRTGPCADAVVEAGVARVVAGARDPNPVVDGRGFDRLRDGGLLVEEGTDAEAERLIGGFAKHVRTGLPLVTLKSAATLDGKVAARDGSSRWITGEPAREEVHRLRAASGAIVVGAGTAVADDPSLTVRLDGHRGRPPLRVLADARGRVSATGKLFDHAAPTLVATTDQAPRERLDEWRGAGAEVLVVDRAAGGGVSLPQLFEALGKREIQDVLVEGGPTLAWSAVAEGLVDRVVLFLAPALLGGTGAPGVIGGEGFAPVGEGMRLRIVNVRRIGEDLEVEADVHRDR